MTQRKLTEDEMSRIDFARFAIAALPKWSEISGGEDYWRVGLLMLSDMATHGTTDGKPYVEPQPEIGDGYRVATKADNDRLDLEVVIDDRWVKTGPGVLDGFTYRVPVDRIPTDEDAKQRPIVMVRDDEDSQWKEKKLLGVAGGHFPFVVVTPDFKPGYYESSQWRLCRFPYTGELD